MTIYLCSKFSCLIVCILGLKFNQFRNLDLSKQIIVRNSGARNMQVALGYGEKSFAIRFKGNRKLVKTTTEN